MAIGTLRKNSDLLNDLYLTGRNQALKVADINKESDTSRGGDFSKN